MTRLSQSPKKASMIILLVLIPVVVATDLDRKGMYVRDDNFADVIPTTPTMTTTARSQVQCAMACLSHSGSCDTFVFQSSTGSCLGLATRMPSLAEMTTSPGFLLFRRVPACPRERGYVWEASLQLCLYFHADLDLDCYDSVHFCRGQGDQLAFLRTAQDVLFVQNLLQASGDDGVYILGAKAGGAGWVWEDGTAVEGEVQAMAPTSYDCLVITRAGLRSMWTTNRRHFLCRRDVTGF